MTSRWLAGLSCIVLAVGFSMAQGAPKAPPPAIPRTANLSPGKPSGGTAVADGQTQYVGGDPTDEEQYYLELLNRARLNPAAEAQSLTDTTDPSILADYSFFSVDLGQLELAFAGIATVPPLAFNPLLIGTARHHSGYMLTNALQSHYEGTLSPFDRMTAAGYNYQSAGENIYAYAESVSQGLAGFEVDWGQGPFGMQSPPGHRENDHDGAYSEIGIGVIDGSNGAPGSAVGPQLVTFDFGSRTGQQGMVTGVAYYDLNGNQLFDLGEGLGGVTVDVPGGSFFAVTSASGGYAVPAPNGQQTVTFSGPGLNQSFQVTLANNANVKLDLRLPYTPPIVSGTTNPWAGGVSEYSTTQVPGATAYAWEVFQLAQITAPFGAENGLSGVATNTTGAYPVVSTDVAQSGSHSYHLASPTSDPQILQLTDSFLAGASPALLFAKQLGYATTNQVASAEVSTDGGGSWATVWSDPGFANPSSATIDRAFHPETVSLPVAAGTVFNVRFRYAVNSGGSFYPQTTPLGADVVVGLYLDDINLVDAQIVAPISTNRTSAPSFGFQPPTAGDFALEVAPVAGTRTLPGGPALAVATSATPPNQIVLGPAVITASGGEASVGVRVLSGSPTTITLEAAPSPQGPFAQFTAPLTALAGGNYSFKITSPPRLAFFRVRAQ